MVRVLRNVVGEHIQVLDNIFATSGARCLYSIAVRRRFSPTGVQNRAHSPGYLAIALVESIRVHP